MCMASSDCDSDCDSTDSEEVKQAGPTAVNIGCDSCYGFRYGTEMKRCSKCGHDVCNSKGCWFYCRWDLHKTGPGICRDCRDSQNGDCGSGTESEYPYFDAV